MMWADIPLTFSIAQHSQNGIKHNSGQGGKKGEVVMK